jgi:hypothetical protein
MVITAPLGLAAASSSVQALGSVTVTATDIAVMDIARVTAMVGVMPTAEGMPEEATDIAAALLTTEATVTP